MVMMAVFMVMIMVMIMVVMMIMVVPVFIVVMMVMFMVVIIIVMMFMIVIMMMLVVVLMMMLMAFVMRILLFAVDGHGHVDAVDAALHGVLALEAHAGQSEGVHPIDEGRRIVQKIAQRGHQHVARRAHVALKIKRFHSDIPFIRLMRLAR